MAHDLVGVVGIERSGAQQPAVEDGADEQLGHHGGVGIGIELALLLPGAQSGDDGIDLRCQQPVDDVGSELGVALDLGGDRPLPAVGGRVDQLGHDGPHDRAHVPDQVTGVGQRVATPGVGRGREHGVEEDRTLVGPPPVDGLLAHAGPGGDGLDGQPGVAHLGHELERGRLHGTAGCAATADVAYDPLRTQLFGSPVVPWGPSSPEDGEDDVEAGPDVAARALVAHLDRDEGPLRLLVGDDAPGPVDLARAARRDDYRADDRFTWPT